MAEGIVERCVDCRGAIYVTAVHPGEEPDAQMASEATRRHRYLAERVHRFAEVPTDQHGHRDTCPRKGDG